MTPAARERLGGRVRARRQQLGLSILDAANAAGVNRMTWDGLEKGTRATRDSNYASIEGALRWRSGSIEAILDGGDPEPADAPKAPPVDTATEELSEIIAMILDDATLSEEDREYFISRARADWEREQDAATERVLERTVTRIEEWKRARSA